MHSGTDALQIVDNPSLRVPTDRGSRFVTAPSPGSRRSEQWACWWDSYPASCPERAAGNVSYKFTLVAQQYRPLFFFAILVVPCDSAGRMKGRGSASDYPPSA